MTEKRKDARGSRLHVKEETEDSRHYVVATRCY